MKKNTLISMKMNLFFSIFAIIFSVMPKSEAKETVLLRSGNTFKYFLFHECDKDLNQAKLEEVESGSFVTADCKNVISISTNQCQGEICVGDTFRSISTKNKTFKTDEFTSKEIPIPRQFGEKRVVKFFFKTKKDKIWAASSAEKNSNSPYPSQFIQIDKVKEIVNKTKLFPITNNVVCDDKNFYCVGEHYTRLHIKPGSSEFRVHFGSVLAEDLTVEGKVSVPQENTIPLEPSYFLTSLNGKVIDSKYIFDSENVYNKGGVNEDGGYSDSSFGFIFKMSGCFDSTQSSVSSKNYCVGDVVEILASRLNEVECAIVSNKNSIDTFSRSTIQVQVLGFSYNYHPGLKSIFPQTPQVSRIIKVLKEPSSDDLCYGKESLVGKEFFEAGARLNLFGERYYYFNNLFPISIKP